MNKEIQELLDKAVAKIKEIDKVEAILLFGSHARETASAQSDIDLLIVVNSSKPQQFLKPIIEKLSEIDLEGRISPRLTNIKELDEEFLETVLREGKLLYGKLIVSGKKLLLQPYILLTYNLSNLKQSEKIKITRAVYGYHSIKKIKSKIYKYTYAGLKNEENVEIVSENTLILPQDQLGFIEFLKRQQVNFKTIKIWKQ